VKKQKPFPLSPSIVINPPPRPNRNEVWGLKEKKVKKERKTPQNKPLVD
jgi:hypothetical protein